VPVAVIIQRRFGRAWRRGTVAFDCARPSVADGSACSPDLFGRELQVCITGHAEKSRLQRRCVGQGAEAACRGLRGLTWRGPDNDASELVRPAAEDMFR